MRNRIPTNRVTPDGGVGVPRPERMRRRPQSVRSHILPSLTLALLLGGRKASATFMVRNTNDSGVGSLRQRPWFCEQITTMSVAGFPRDTVRNRRPASCRTPRACDDPLIRRLSCEMRALFEKRGTCRIVGKRGGHWVQKARRSTKAIGWRDV